jgi:hypothetical protein
VVKDRTLYHSLTQTMRYYSLPSQTRRTPPKVHGRHAGPASPIPAKTIHQTPRCHPYMRGSLELPPRPASLSNLSMTSTSPFTTTASRALQHPFSIPTILAIWLDVLYSPYGSTLYRGGMGMYPGMDPNNPSRTQPLKQPLNTPSPSSIPWCKLSQVSHKYLIRRS